MLDYNLDLSEQSFMHVLSTDSPANAFPFCLYEEGYFEAGKDYYTVRDNKPMYLLIYTVSGGGTVRVGERMRHLTAGSAVMLDCRRYHEYRTVSEEPWCFHWIHFDGPAMSGYAGALCEELTVVEIREKVRLTRNFDSIHELLPETGSLTKYARVTDLVAGILLILLNSLFGTRRGDEIGQDAVSAVCHYIEENLEKDITVEALADHVHLSKFYFIRLFKRYMGVSPYRYVQLSRLNRAKGLLISTDYRVNQISDMTGFCNPTRFTKMFAEVVGTTPTKFRKSSFNLPEENILNTLEYKTVQDENNRRFDHAETPSISPTEGEAPANLEDDSERAISDNFSAKNILADTEEPVV